MKHIEEKRPSLLEIITAELGLHGLALGTSLVERGFDWEAYRWCKYRGCTAWPCRTHKALSALRVTVEAMTEAAKAEGPFSVEPLVHAANTIESMVRILNEALAAARKEMEG